MLPESSLYIGKLRHRRFEPKRHEFTYSIFMAFLDIDKIEEVMGRSRLSSYNGWNWASFHEPVPLRKKLGLPDGPVFVLTHLHYLGYSFNPISLYYCYGEDGRVNKVLAEVNSTFGETTLYWLTEENRDPSSTSRKHRCRKDMHVSPFMGMEHDYEFVLTEPAEALVAHMNTPIAGTTRNFFDATLTLQREPWTAANLRRALIRLPWMTAKVTLAIHWEALKLWIKGVPVFTHPKKLPSNEAPRTT